VETKHRDLITRCSTAQDEFQRLVTETDEVAVEVQTCDNAAQNAAFALAEGGMVRTTAE
jgi:hypothetical protein